MSFASCALASFTTCERASAASAAKNTCPTEPFDAIGELLDVVVEVGHRFAPHSLNGPKEFRPIELVSRLALQGLHVVLTVPDDFLQGLV